MKSDGLTVLIILASFAACGLILMYIASLNILPGNWSYINSIFLGALPYLILIGISLFILSRRR